MTLSIICPRCGHTTQVQSVVFDPASTRDTPVTVKKCRICGHEWKEPPLVSERPPTTVRKLV